MNTAGYIVLMSAIATILLAFFIFLTFKKNSILLVTLKMMILSAFCIIASYIPSLFASSAWVSKVFYAIYFIANTWVCASIFLFGKAYIGNNVDIKAIHYLSVGAVIADNISLIVNIFTNHEVTYNYIYGDLVSCWKFSGTPWFQAHLALCYILLAVFVIEVVAKIFKSPSIYKEQYVVILAILLICVIGNGIFLIQADVIDLSVVLYGFAGMAFYYFSIDFLPHKLRRDMGQLILSKMNSALVFFDLDGKCIFSNGASSSTFLTERNKTTLSDFANTIDVAVADLKDKQVCPFVYKDGVKYFMVNYQKFTDSHQRYLGCFFRLDDVTKEREEQGEKLYLATHDRLTGVYNEDTFFREARSAIDSHPTVPYSVIATNISQFKFLNDLLGQETGDRLLIDIGKIIDEFNGEGIMYGRLESDKFAICAPTKMGLAEKIEEKIEKRIEELRKNNNISLMVFNRCGVYEVAEPSLSLATMCDRATMALNSAKGDITRKVIYYDTKMLNEMMLENELIAELPAALKEKQFVIYYQPQVDSRTDTIVGAEALVRWNHPQRGLIPPGVFIPLFERTGHIYELDRYVWAEACKTIKKLNALGYEVPISVNISPRDIYSGDVFQIITGLVHQYGLRPQSLNLEITESAVILDMDHMNDLIFRFKEEGFKIEMDDFGSGYSSLNTLKDLPVDVLKLDMLFLKSIKGSVRGEKILSAIIALARSISAPIIAEGVEDRQQVDFLLNLGCHNLQGYFYSKPIPYDLYLEMLHKYQTGPLI
jgi:diguanylate cyclase (GGDEF)-like protein